MTAKSVETEADGPQIRLLESSVVFDLFVCVSNYISK